MTPAPTPPAAGQPGGAETKRSRRLPVQWWLVSVREGRREFDSFYVRARSRREALAVATPQAIDRGYDLEGKHSLSAKVAP